MHNVFRTHRFLLCSVLLAFSVTTPAFTLDQPDRFAFTARVAPRVSVVGAPRTIFINGCTGPVTLDESLVASTSTLVIRIAPEFVGGCVAPTIVLNYTPRNIGNLRLVMRLPDGSIVAETQMETVASAHSTINLDGMWFDAATNGSGISFHHSESSDTAFGTWFLYGTSNTFVSRWYSLQGMQWTQNGTTLVGVAYEPVGSGPPLCVVGDDCPRPAAIKPVGSITISVIDRDNVRVEAFDQFGRSAFVSPLKRLGF